MPKPLTTGPHVGDPPTVLQSADVNELNRALAEAQTELQQLHTRLSDLEARAAGHRDNLLFATIGGAAVGIGLTLLVTGVVR